MGDYVKAARPTLDAALPSFHCSIVPCNLNSHPVEALSVRKQHHATAAMEAPGPDFLTAPMRSNGIAVSAGDEQQVCRTRQSRGVCVVCYHLICIQHFGRHSLLLVLLLLVSGRCSDRGIVVG